MTQDSHIIGGGLAGSEAAWQLAQAGVRVRLLELRELGSLIMAMGDRHAVPHAANAPRGSRNWKDAGDGTDHETANRVGSHC